MKFRLDVEHYRDDVLIPAGTEVGDNCGVTWRDPKGHAYPPSMQMTPLDEEAKKMLKDKFATETPDRDPTKPIPLQGTGDKVKITLPGVPRPGTTPQEQHRAEIANHTPPVYNTAPAKPAPAAPTIK